MTRDLGNGGYLEKDHQESNRWPHDTSSRLWCQHDIRKRIEKGFGWLKTVGGPRKTEADRPRKAQREAAAGLFGVQLDPVGAVRA